VGSLTTDDEPREIGRRDAGATSPHYSSVAAGVDTSRRRPFGTIDWNDP